MALDLGTICNNRVAREQLWTNNTRGGGNYNRQIPLAEYLLNNQAVVWDGDLKDLRKCIPLDAYWARICDNAPLSDCSGITCTISGSPRITGNKVTYDKNFCFIDTFSVSDDECKNDFAAQKKIAMEMENVMRKFRGKTNSMIIANLDSQYTPTVLPAGMPSFIQVNPTTGAVQIPASYWNHDLIVYLITIAEYNDIQMPALFGGSTFYHANKNSQLNQLNSNQKDESAKYNQLPMVFDLRWFDPNFTTPTVFLSDASGFGFFNAWEHDNTTPVEFLAKDSSYVYRVTDRMLKWNDGGTMRSLYYDVYVQENCIVVNGTRRKKFDFEMRYAGGIHNAPADCNGGNGILKIEMV